MAEGEEREKDALLSNPILQDISGSISHILRQLGHMPKEDIVSQLSEDIDNVLIHECREYLFNAAVGQYDEKLEDNGLPSGKTRLELKCRRGESANEKCARDIVEMLLYVCGMRGDFPREVLGSRSTYVDFEVSKLAETRNNKGNNSDGCAHCGTFIQTLMENYDKCEKSLCKLKEYVLNIEKVMGDELKQLKQSINHADCGKELIMDSRTKHVSASHAPRMVGHSLSRHYQPWQANPGGSVHKGETPNQLTEPDLRTAGQKSSPRIQINDNSQSANIHIEDLGDDTEDWREADEIPCGQGHPPSDNNDRLIPQITNGNVLQQKPSEEHNNENRTAYSSSTLQSTQQPELPADRHVTPNIGHTAGSDHVTSGGEGVAESNRPGNTNQHSSNIGMENQGITYSDNIASNKSNTMNTTSIGNQGRTYNDNMASNISNTMNTTGMGNQGRTYSDTASSPGPWNTISRNKPKKEMNTQRLNSEQNTLLTGIKPEKSAVLYVENIRKYQGDTLKLLAERVRNHCRLKGVRVMNARIITNRFCEDTVGCKITVPIRQVDDVIGTRAWPDEVNCRRWTASRGQPGDDRRRNDVNRRDNNGQNERHRDGHFTRENNRSQSRSNMSNNYDRDHQQGSQYDQNYEYRGQSYSRDYEYNNELRRDREQWHSEDRERRDDNDDHRNTDRWTRHGEYNRGERGY